MIKNIVFDIGSVLVDFRYHDYMLDLGFSTEAVNVIEEKIVQNDIWGKLDLGIEPIENVMEEMYGRAPGYEKEVHEFFDKIIDIVQVYPYTNEWIKSFKSKGYKVFLLSNYPKDMYDMHEKEKFTFTSLVDGKIISGHVKMVKPDKEIYKQLLDTYQLKEEECVFIDDRPLNVESAVKLGFHGIVFSTFEEVDSQLQNLLKKENGD